MFYSTKCIEITNKLPKHYYSDQHLVITDNIIEYLTLGMVTNGK